MNKLFYLASIVFILFISVSCSANTQYIGYFAEEFNPTELKENHIIYNDHYWQKKDIENEFDSISFFYKTTSTFERLGKEEEMIDYGYLIAKKGSQSYILGKYTPTIIYNADGDPIIEVPESHPMYNKIVGLNEDVAEYALGMYLNLREDDGTIFAIDPYRSIEIDILNRSIFKDDPRANFE